MNFRDIHRFAAIARAAAPGYGTCHRCGFPWRFVKEHSTEYARGRACFPLCESCWSALTPGQRLHYYRELWDEWEADGVNKDGEMWDAIRDAVLDGK